MQLKRCEAEAAAAGARIDKMAKLQERHTAELAELRRARAEAEAAAAAAAAGAAAAGGAE